LTVGLQKKMLQKSLMCVVAYISDRRAVSKMESGHFARHLIFLGPIFVVGSISLAELVVAVASSAYGWWFVFCCSLLLMLLLLHIYAFERDLEAAILLQVADRQNLALADALRLVEVLRSLAAKQRKASSSVERAKAGLRRGSRSAGDLDIC